MSRCRGMVCQTASPPISLVTFLADNVKSVSRISVGVIPFFNTTAANMGARKFWLSWYPSSTQPRQTWGKGNSVVVIAFFNRGKHGGKGIQLSWYPSSTQPRQTWGKGIQLSWYPSSCPHVCRGCVEEGYHDNWIPADTLHICVSSSLLVCTILLWSFRFCLYWNSATHSVPHTFLSAPCDVKPNVHGKLKVCWSLVHTQSIWIWRLSEVFGFHMEPETMFCFEWSRTLITQDAYMIIDNLRWIPVVLQMHLFMAF